MHGLRHRFDFPDHSAMIITELNAIMEAQSSRGLEIEGLRLG